MRAILALVVIIVLGLGVAAYFVNVPILSIAIAEVFALAWIAFRVTRPRQPQPLAESAQDQATKR